ncbi:MAG TPA: DNA-binding response regulator [Deltaproteobacteria bacterium]|nr:MAG: hypothetical protein A2Z79_04210 [Deltaproteobacteria bacterium GWA2_55_82]OGQ64130.1 MAG: hypothetical protein A3I81_10590 [Deltaproteobacteria bacterium RIFCSPLOWO2_02_FULL_55_12]OIJ74582.1 MAG: hypothetical protein A2V21_310115 [Deltaproteobacteria bacterium GWC2_55_46]HBG46476.1 DNA-binding response regulator [Deltaproteobacteria bacterium]HCY10688.1 DNA-binding response regulator [Deltaproteobacteria bacterium]
MKKTTIFIADDHPVIRNGIKSVLPPGEFDIVGEADNGAAALKGIAALKPDIAILDITMPGLDGISATKRISEDFPDTRVIILSMHADISRPIEAFRAGALGYVLKDSDPRELLSAVEKVRAGSKYASPAVTEDLLNDFVDVIKKDQGQDPFDTLSQREKEILKHIADGSTSREIAEKLFISLATVKSHRNNIMKKLKVHDMASLIKTAIRKGIVHTD